jgi:ribosomal protein S18 acetylase RimI-like enzyme
MAPATEISDLAISVKASLSPAELDDVAALIAEAHWNQVAPDWRVFLAHGRVYAASTAAGRIIATTATLPYGGRFAWISMVLVAGSYRRRGLATLLMRRAIDELVDGGLVPVLDATPAGRAVYRGLGFADCWSFERLLRSQTSQQAARVSPPPLRGVSVRPLRNTDWPQLCALDSAAFGAQRNGVVASLRGRLPQAELVAETEGRIVGFMLGRDGRLASQLGPLIAKSDAIAEALLARALCDTAGPLFIDVADAKSATKAFLHQQGFAASRPFTRMVHGRATRFDDPALTFAVVGPEFG